MLRPVIWQIEFCVFIFKYFKDRFGAHFSDELVLPKHYFVLQHLHFVIEIYFLLSSRFPTLRVRPLICLVGYCKTVYLVFFGSHVRLSYLRQFEYGVFES